MFVQLDPRQMLLGCSPTDSILFFFCPFCAGFLLKNRQGLSAWLSADDGNVRTASASVVAALPIEKCKRNVGVDSVGMPAGACERCCRSHRGM